MPQDCVQRIIKVGRKSLASVLTRGMEVDVNYAMMSEEDWRLPLINYLQYPALPSEKRIRIMALNYVMWIMGEVREGICGAHQGGRKMYWLIQRYGYFWPTMMKDCIEYSKGCEACQRHGPIQ